MSKSQHWYTMDGRACYEVPYKDPAKGMRATTLADARKMNLLPSVTTITSVLNAPAIVAWKVRIAIEAALTTPRRDGEDIDSFANRVAAVDAENISETAKQLGTDVHDAIEKALSYKPYSDGLLSYVAPVLGAVQQLGQVVGTEKILVGNGYAGKTDCLIDGDDLIVVDFKTTRAKELPKKSYDEHKLQLAAYAKCFGQTGKKRINTCNIYISTLNPGQISVCHNPDWEDSFDAFEHVLKIWQWQNNYCPKTDAAESSDIIP